MCRSRIHNRLNPSRAAVRAGAIALGLCFGVGVATGAVAAPKRLHDAALESFELIPPRDLAATRAPDEGLRAMPASAVSTARAPDSRTPAVDAFPGRVIPPEPGLPLLRFFDAVAACADVDLETERRAALVGRLPDAPRLGQLEQFWSAHEMAPEAILDGAEVPPLFLDRLPRDMSDDMDVPRKKRGFIMLMLPHVLAVNAEIMADRARLLSLQARLDEPEGQSDAEIDWLLGMFETYGVDDHDMNTLLARVDGIPPALAIAQAAKESGWGSSRFAQKGNAMFGQWTWDPTDKGIVPLQRPAGKTYRVRAFDNLLAATRAYALNINRHSAYGRLREIRRRLRAKGKAPNGLELTSALDKYSTIGQRYVRALNRLIKNNDLTRLNDAQLAAELVLPTPPAPLAPATVEPAVAALAVSG